MRVCVRWLLVVACSGSLAVVLAGEPVVRAVRVADVRDWLSELQRQPKPDEGDYRVNGPAAERLRALAPENRDVLPELIAALDDNESRVRAIAAEAIGQLGPQAKAAVPALRKTFRAALDPKHLAPDISKQTAAALGAIGEDAADAAGDLIEGLADESNSEFMSSVALRRIGADAVPALRKGLRDSRPHVRDVSLTLLASSQSATPADIEAISGLLGDPNDSYRPISNHFGYRIEVGMAAQESLQKLGPRAAPQLRAALDSANLVARSRAGCLLAGFERPNRRVLDQLPFGLCDPHVASDALKAAKTLDPQQRLKLIARIRAQLRLPAGTLPPRFRYLAAAALAKLGSVDETVLRIDLDRLQTAVRAEARDAEGSEDQERGESPDHVTRQLSESGAQLKLIEPELIAMATAAGPDRTRWLAATLLARVAPEHAAVKAIVRELGATLRTDNTRDRHRALTTAVLIGKVGLPLVFETLRNGQDYIWNDPAPDCLPAVIQEVARVAAEPKRDVRYLTRLIGFASLQHPPDEWVAYLPLLVKQFDKSGLRQSFADDEWKESLQRTIVSFGGRSVPVLVRALDESHLSFERTHAILHCLATIGPAAHDAIPALLKTARLRSEDSRYLLVEAIAKIGPTRDCLPLLVESLDDFLVLHADEALVALGTTALPTAVKLLESPSESRRTAGRKVLLALGPKATPAIAPIIGMLQRNVGDDVQLMQILAALGTAAAEARPVVASRLHSSRVRVRAAACITLARICPTDPGLVEVLVAATKDNFVEVRAAAADATALVGSNATVAKPALAALQHDDFATVRHAAERAMNAVKSGHSSSLATWERYFDPQGPSSAPAPAPGD